MPSVWLYNNVLKKWCKKFKLGEVDGDFSFNPQLPISDPLIDAISVDLRIEKNLIYCGAGISQFIIAIISNPIWDKVFLPTIEFGLYNRACVYFKKNIEYISAQSTQEFTKKIGIIESTANSLLCFSSPKWFTGERFTLEQIKFITQNFHGHIFIDEAYVDYADNPNQLIDLCLQNDRIILARSFSKKYMASGLRAGYIITKYNIDELRSTAIPPHSVSTHSIKLLVNLIKDQKLNQSFDITRKYISSNRDLIIKSLQYHKSFKIIKSSSNFVTLLFNSEEELDKIFNKIYHFSGVNKYKIHNSYFIKIWVKNLNISKAIINCILN